MSVLDYVIVALLLGWLAAVLAFWIRQRKQGDSIGCGCCCGCSKSSAGRSCADCKKQAPGQEEKDGRRHISCNM